jgi:hypothetical protein
LIGISVQLSTTHTFSKALKQWRILFEISSFPGKYITDITVASNDAKIALLVASVVLNRIARTENSMLHFNLIKVSITLSLMLNLLRRLEIEQQICIPFRFWRYKYSQFLAMCLLSPST